MTDPTVTRVAHTIARRWLTQPVEVWDLARTVDGHLVTAGEVEAELARIAGQLLTADELAAVVVNLRGWLELGDDPLLRSAITKLAGEPEVARPVVAPYGTHGHLPVKVYEPKHPLATGRCENCDGEMVYNLAANIREHTDETECTDPWPATPGIGRD